MRTIKSFSFTSRHGSLLTTPVIPVVRPIPSRKNDMAGRAADDAKSEKSGGEDGAVGDGASVRTWLLTE